MSVPQMQIPSNKVNLAEKDIENYLFDNPKALSYTTIDPQTEENYTALIYKWAGRQVRVPSGIIDLLGYIDNVEYRDSIAVVELKQVEIDSDALTQVSRYAADIEKMLEIAHVCCDVQKIIVGPKISDKHFAEASALNIIVFTFQPLVSAVFLTMHWTEQYIERANAEYQAAVSTDGVLGEIVGKVRAESASTKWTNTVYPQEYPDSTEDEHEID